MLRCVSQPAVACCNSNTARTHCQQPGNINVALRNMRWYDGDMSTNEIEWILSVIGEDTQGAAADKAGIQRSTLARQWKTGKISPENIVAIACAYNVNPIDGLIAVGLITKEHTSQYGIRQALALASSEDIMNEIWNRIVATQGGDTVFTGPMKPYFNAPNVKPNC